MILQLSYAVVPNLDSAPHKWSQAESKVSPDGGGKWTNELFCIFLAFLASKMYLNETT